MNFEIERKGYKKQQVDEHIKKLTMQYENAAAEQKDRIFELKGSLSTMEKLLETYKQKEGEINAALLAAVNKAKEMEDIAEKKYDLEIQRLKLFNAKWQSYFNEIIKRYPIDDNLVSVASFTSEMANILSGGKGQPAPIEFIKPEPAKPEKGKPQKKAAPHTKASDIKAQHESEKKRLSEIKPDPMNSINDYFQNQNKQAGDKKGTAATKTAPRTKNVGIGTNGFDINEALHPEQSIEDILKDLL